MSRLYFPVILTSILAFINSVQCLSSIPGSPCYDTCNGSTSTASSDIVCLDKDWTGSTKGDTLTACMTCLESSDYSNGFMTDQILFLYYLTTVQQTCLSGTPAAPISNCVGQCSIITSAFTNIGGRAFFQSPYDYCTANSNAYESAAPDCSTCLLRQQGVSTLANFVSVGEKGCDEQPDLRSGAAIDFAGGLFDVTSTSGIGSATATSASATGSVSTTASSSVSRSSASSTSDSTTSNTSASSTTTSPSSSSAVAQASATAAPNSNKDDDKQDNGGSTGLSRGAAAGIGIALGIIGIAAILLLAIFARKRMLKKQEGAGAGPWSKMRDSPEMQQAAPETTRGATPPAAGVFVPVPPPIPADVVPKSSKSFRSRTSKSLRSLRNNLTPRTSEWYNAAYPKQSSDLSALPQRGWD